MEKQEAKGKPAPTGEIAEFVTRQPLFGAHPHIQPVPEWAETRPHVSSLLGYAAADLAVAAILALPGGCRFRHLNEQ